MGFPASYSDLLPLPRFLLRVVLFLGYLRELIRRSFDAIGLGDLLDSEEDEHHYLHYQQRFRSPSAMLIQEALPAVRYEKLEAAGGHHVGGSCAVCLHEFEAAEEVRQLTNCRHVFHTGCLDPWLEYEQRTCPLCRTALLPEEMQEALLPEEMQEALDEPMWAAAGVPDSYLDELFSFSLALNSPDY